LFSKVGAHCRESWQAHVDAEGRQGGQKAQQQGERHEAGVHAQFSPMADLSVTIRETLPVTSAIAANVELAIN
jgi:hypothetical protein